MFLLAIGAGTETISDEEWEKINAEYERVEENWEKAIGKYFSDNSLELIFVFLDVFLYIRYHIKILCVIIFVI